MTRTTSTTFRGTPSGFTLVELLVVVAIIILLLSIFVPAIDKVLIHSEIIVCQSRMRQINLANLSYCMDHSRRLPRPNSNSADDTPSFKKRGWLYFIEESNPSWNGNMSQKFNGPQDVTTGALWIYMFGERHDPSQTPDPIKVNKYAEMFRCPSHTKPYPANAQRLTSYCMNRLVIMGGGHDERNEWWTWRITDFDAQAIIYWEADELQTGGYWNDGTNYAHEGNGTTSRHITGGQVANADGSTSWLQYEEYWAEVLPRPPSSPTRLWCVPYDDNGYP